MPSNSKSGLERLNALPVEKAEKEFLKCCGCLDWARQMAAERPFATVEQLTDTADRIWWQLEPDDWLAAFRSHPKIGEEKAAAATPAEAQEWSAAEQSGVRDSAPTVMQELATLNREYEQRFGYIYIVCATGKSSEEMLKSLRRRIGNGPDEELRTAAAEQARIAQLRLQKLLDSLLP